MSWQNEPLSFIAFISPKFNRFTPKWKGNERSVEKKLGYFDIPRQRGTVVQDLDSKSILYPLTVYFDGLSNQTDAGNFFKAMDEERGQWIVIHPTKGQLVLQLVSAREVIAPIDDGNFTVVETQWIEPANKERFVLPFVNGALGLLKVVATIQDFTTSLKQLRSDLYAAVTAVTAAINTIAGFSDALLSEIAATQTLVNDAWNDAKASVENLKNMFEADPTDPEIIEDLGAAMADMIIIPSGASSGFEDRTAIYSELMESIITVVPDGAGLTDDENFNKIVTFEFTMMTILNAMCQILLTADFKSRADIVVAMDFITTFFNNAINKFEGIQENFEGLDIDKQYFSQGSAFNAVQSIFSLTNQYLLGQFFNAKVEKRIILKKKRSPLEITVTEYGDLGENDSNYDLFLSSNNLTGDDILILPAGREVVVYV